MNPYDLLKNDHEKVSKLFERIESASGKEKLAGFKKLKADLDLHALIEEQIFYPALKNAKESRAITLEAYQEHRVLKDLLAELAASEHSDQWDAKFTVLKENVEHHVDEEEGDLFDKAKDVLSDEQAEALGDQMAAEKERQGAPVPEELRKPGLIKRVVKTLFGGGTTTRGAKKKKAGKRAAKKRAAKKTAASRGKKSAGKSKKPAGQSKKSAGKASTKKRASKKASRKQTGAKKKATKKR